MMGVHNRSNFHCSAISKTRDGKPGLGRRFLLRAIDLACLDACTWPSSTPRQAAYSTCDLNTWYISAASDDPRGKLLHARARPCSCLEFIQEKKIMYRPSASDIDREWERAETWSVATSTWPLRPMQQTALSLCYTHSFHSTDW